MSADPAMVAAMCVAAHPLVPIAPPRCASCGRCVRLYGGPADQLGDGTDICGTCVLDSFAESG